MATIEEFLDDAGRRMDKSIETTRNEFNSVRTGRASAALLDRITIDYYGTPTQLKNMATIGVPEPRAITVQPFDPTQVKAIEKAIMESDLGLSPSNDGKMIRLPIPQLTEDRRKELVKLVRRYGEDGKIAIRNVRRDAMKHLEELVKNGEVGDDEERRGEQQVQKLTDDHVKSIDDLMKHKETEIMEV
jgi:ribosome recycling factor